MKQNNLTVLSNHIRCKGVWTRIQKDQKSVTDYGLIMRQDDNRVERVTIDENKEITPYRVADEIVYTDHCAMLTVMNWEKKERVVGRSKFVINLNKLKKVKGKQALVKAVESKSNIKEKYKGWQKELNNLLSKCKQKINCNRSKISKIMRKLMKEKRKYKTISKKDKNKQRRKMASIQEKLIDEYIVEEKKKEEGNKIKCTVEDIKAKGGVNSPAFWEFKSRMDGRKQEGATAVRTKDGTITEEIEEIKKKSMRDTTKSSS